MPRKQITYSSHPTHRARMVHAQGERQFRTYDTSHIRPQRSKAPAVVAGILAIVVVIAAVFGVTTAMKGCSTDPVDGAQVVTQADVQVVVPEGAAASEVADVLQNAGAIPSASDFLARAKELGVDARFQAGTYSFAAGMTLDDVINAVATGNLGMDVLSIPEGYKLVDIASAVEQATEGRVSADEFVKTAQASSYASEYEFLSGAPEGASLEGFLFPKTYDLANDATADSIIRMMLNQFASEVASLDWSYPESLGMSIYDAVNLASIVEKESSGDEQIRAQVAAVFYNRLSPNNVETAAGYLQSDATTAYEVGHDPSGEEVQADTPYSTYANPGLPPTPICSPSIDCLQAVCAPASGYEGYYYFIFWTNDQGQTEYAFSKTYDEHQAAIAAHL